MPRALARTDKRIIPPAQPLQGFEQRRSFKYAELAFKDRDSARQTKVSGGTQRTLFWLSVMLLVLCLGSEVAVLVKGLPQGTGELVVGRVLGLLDAIAMTVLANWYGTSRVRR